MNSDIRVTDLAASEDSEYREFLNDLGQTHQGVLAYHYPFFRDMLIRIGIGKPLYLAARRGSRIVGALPGFTKTTGEGTVYSSLPYFGPNAGVICRPGSQAETIHTRLLEEVFLRLRAVSHPVAASFYTPLGFDAFDYYESVLPRERILVEKFTQSHVPDDYMPKKKLRYDLRKAQKNGVRVSSRVTSSRMDAFYDVYAENCRTRAIPLKPRDTLDALLSSDTGRNRVGIYFALRKEQVISGCVILRGPRTISVYMLATREEDRPLQPASLVVDYALREAAERGIRCWNWEASPSRGDGVYQFKKKWGATESGYRTYVVPFQDAEVFQALGADGIREQWPHFFVYPFSRLEVARGA